MKEEIYTIGLEKPEILYLGKFGLLKPEIQEKVMKIKQEIVYKKIIFES